MHDHDDREPKPAPRDISDAPMPQCIEALMAKLPRPLEPTEAERDASLAQFTLRWRIGRASRGETLESPLADLPPRRTRSAWPGGLR